MDTSRPSKTARFEDTDLVTTDTFNEALASLDRTIATVKNIAVTSANQLITSFNSSLTDNICIFINMKALASCNVTIKIIYEDSFGTQNYEVLDNFQVTSLDSYNFNPIYISINPGTLVQIVASSSRTDSKVFISASAIVA